MAYIVATKPGRFEARESRTTADGPRSRTLAGFRELDDEVIAKIRERASKPVTEDELRRRARRVGAPVAQSAVNRAARELIAELGRGEEPDPRLRRMLVDLLAERSGPSPASDAPPSIAEWMSATPAERGETLEDLLLLADALPHRGRVGKPLEFPPLVSSHRP